MFHQEIDKALYVASFHQDGEEHGEGNNKEQNHAKWNNRHWTNLSSTQNDYSKNCMQANRKLC